MAMPVLRKWKWLLGTLIAATGLAALRRGVRGTDVLDLKAADVSLHEIVPQTKDPVTRFSESSPYQVAVLLTKGNEGELGTVHALREMGIPFFVTRDVHRALMHHLVLIGPWVDSRTFSEQEAQEVARFVIGGGIIYAENIFWGALKPIFGFKSFEASRKRHWVSFENVLTPLFRYLDRPEERRVRLGSLQADTIFATNGYQSDGTSEVLAGSKTARRRLWAGR
jgi:hypothetical protein